MKLLKLALAASFVLSSFALANNTTAQAEKVRVLPNGVVIKHHDWDADRDFDRFHRRYFIYRTYNPDRDFHRRYWMYRTYNPDRDYWRWRHHEWLERHGY